MTPRGLMSGPVSGGRGVIARLVFPSGVVVGTARLDGPVSPGDVIYHGHHGAYVVRDSRTDESLNVTRVWVTRLP